MPLGESQPNVPLQEMIFTTKEQSVSQPLLFLEPFENLKHLVLACFGSDTVYELTSVELRENLEKLQVSEVIYVFEKYLQGHKQPLEKYFLVFAEYFCHKNMRSQILQMVECCHGPYKLRKLLIHVVNKLEETGMNYSYALYKVLQKYKDRSLATSFIILNLITDKRNSIIGAFERQITNIVEFLVKNQIKFSGLYVERLLKSCVKLPKCTFKTIKAANDLLNLVGRNDREAFNSIDQKLITEFIQMYTSRSF